MPDVIGSDARGIAASLGAISSIGATDSSSYFPATVPEQVVDAYGPENIYQTINDGAPRRRRCRRSRGFGPLHVAGKSAGRPRSQAARCRASRQTDHRPRLSILEGGRPVGGPGFRKKQGTAAHATFRQGRLFLRLQRRRNGAVASKPERGKQEPVQRARFR